MTWPRARACRVYPRACGGTWNLGHFRANHTGLSPRLRGNRLFLASLDHRGRSIPAPAGEPSTPDTGQRRQRVYPRACGGTEVLLRREQTGLGLSPRLRGNQAHGVQHAEGAGSIPAPAGEPGPAPAAPRLLAVYPRACGGTSNIPGLNNQAMGLSPRLRGNPAAVIAQDKHLRSIPAPAGEPCRRCPPPPGPWVYPRACGGTPCTIIFCIGILDGHVAG